MAEVFAIIIACVALVLGLLVIAWAYGDFRPRPHDATPPPPQTPPTS